ncbi:Uncharacterized protein HZ326_27767 [Fusarium oxysporum f. sp. albedinis]|nr:Uncharacterized protein HZ326_27767 [Fusarium oxysporum f. sp. albedinis]
MESRSVKSKCEIGLQSSAAKQDSLPHLGFVCRVVKTLDGTYVCKSKCWPEALSMAGCPAHHIELCFLQGSHLNLPKTVLCLRPLLWLTNGSN